MDSGATMENLGRVSIAWPKGSSSFRLSGRPLQCLGTGENNMVIGSLRARLPPVNGFFEIAGKNDSTVGQRVALRGGDFEFGFDRSSLLATLVKRWMFKKPVSFPSGSMV